MKPTSSQTVAPQSQNEGRIITANGRRFYIKDGRRLWLDHPPAHIIPDLLHHVR
jgi:hypothetical protein